jgi:hypothetical protein
MKFILSFIFLVSFSVKASPNMSVKERLRLHLWSQGMDNNSVKTVKKQQVLPEEIERALKKF